MAASAYIRFILRSIYTKTFRCDLLIRMQFGVVVLISFKKPIFEEKNQQPIDCKHDNKHLIHFSFCNLPSHINIFCFILFVQHLCMKFGAQF